MTSEEDCVGALREAARVLDESPTKAQYERLGLTPVSGTIIRQCGGWNAAKEAAGLETNPSTGSRTADKPDDVELPEGVEWAELSQDQRWHYRQRTLQRRQRLQAWLFEQKRERGCTECGEDDGACLEFHHRDRTEKSGSVSQLTVGNYPWEEIREEITKCEVLCANCHRKEHYDRPDGVNEPDET